MEQMRTLPRSLLKTILRPKKGMRNRCGILPQKEHIARGSLDESLSLPLDMQTSQIVTLGPSAANSLSARQKLQSITEVQSAANRGAHLLSAVLKLFQVA